MKEMPDLICGNAAVGGNYNSTRDSLSREDNVYVPSSALLEDIKRLTDAPSQVLAILEKSVDADIYSTVKHVAKGLNLNNITLPQEINAMINLDNYIYRGK